MSKKINSPTTIKALEIGIALIQFLDIALHAATNQLEPMRITSNLIILLWLALMVSEKFKSKYLPIAASSISAYLLLNSVFLVLFSATVAPGGPLRMTLFVLILLTITFSTGLVILFNWSKKNEKYL